MNIKKIIFYVFFSITLLICVVVAGLGYRLIYQDKPINIKDIRYNIDIGAGEEIVFKTADLVFSYDKSIESFQLSAKGKIEAYVDTALVAEIENFRINADLFDYFKSLTVPVDIKSESSKIYIDNFPEVQSKKMSITHCILKLKLFINAISQNRSIFVRSFDFPLANIAYKKQSYLININSSLSKDDYLKANIAMSSGFGNSKIGLEISNAKQIDTKLSFVKFPIEVFEDFIPPEMSSKYLIEAYNGVQLNGELRYVIDSVTQNSLIAANLKNQRLKPGKKTDALDQIAFELTVDREFDNINLNKFSLDLINSTSLKASAKIKAKKKLLDVTYQIQSDISLVDMPIDSLEMFWPTALAPDVRAWLISSLTGGVVDKANCVINITDSNKISADTVLAEVTFSNMTLDYYNEHKQLKKLNGIAKFNGDEVVINIKDGEVENAKIFDSTVEVKYSDKDLPLIIKANTSGGAVNYISYIDDASLGKIERAGLDLPNMTGNLEGKVYLNIPLAHDIDLQNIILDVNANLRQAQVTYNKNINISDGELNLIISNKEAIVTGDAKVNMQPASLKWTSDFFNNDENSLDHKLEASLDLGPDSFLEEVTGGKGKITNGKGKIRLEYLSYPKREAVVLKADLGPAELKLPAINLTKELGKSASFELAMSSENGGNWVSKGLSFISENNINIAGNAEFEHDLKELKMFSGDFRYDANNFVVNYKSLSDKILVDIKGKRIDLSHYEITELFKSNSRSANLIPIVIECSLDKVQMPNDVEFSNVKVDFSCNHLGCNKGLFTLDLGENAKGSIVLNKANNLMEWKVKTNDAAKFLRAFNIYKNISTGSLEIVLKQVSPSKSQIEPAYVGELVMTDFTATKTPILAKLISFSSFRGILSILQSYRTIPFRKMKSSFVLANDVIRVNNTYLTGDYLTLTVNGVLDLNQRYINLYGKVVPPVYGLNYTLSLIPFIGHKLAGEDGRKGLIAANYKIQGSFDDARTFVNPMSMLIPEFFSSEIMELFIP